MKNSTNSISPFVITKENLKLYLVQKGLLKKGEQAVIVPLDGGFVNPIFRVTNTTKDFVVKQAMESSSKIASFTKLARERSGYEFQFLRLIRERLLQNCIGTSFLKGAFILMLHTSSESMLQDCRT